MEYINRLESDFEKIRIKVSEIVEFDGSLEHIEVRRTNEARAALGGTRLGKDRYEWDKLFQSIRCNGFVPELELRGPYNSGDVSDMLSAVSRPGFLVKKVSGGYLIDNGFHRYGALIVLGIKDIYVYIKKRG